MRLASYLASPKPNPNPTPNPTPNPNKVRLASYLAISAAPPDDVRGFLPLLRAVLAGLREERMDPTQPVRVGLLSDHAD